MSFNQPHCHGPDLADCEVREVLSNVADMAEESHSSPYLIYCSSTGTISEAARARMPSKEAVKKQAQRTRRKKNPRPLANLVIDDDDCLSLANEEMLQFDNNGEEKRIIILTTTLDILEESKSWYVDETFDFCPQLF